MITFSNKLWGLILHLLGKSFFNHYNDVIMSTMGSQNTRLMIVYSGVYSGANQRKYQSSTSLAFVWGIHQQPVDSPHKGPVTQKMFPFDDVIMKLFYQTDRWLYWGRSSTLQGYLSISKFWGLYHWSLVINGWVVSSQTLLDMWLLIHFGIIV